MQGHHLAKVSLWVGYFRAGPLRHCRSIHKLLNRRGLCGFENLLLDCFGRNWTQQVAQLHRHSPVICRYAVSVGDQNDGTSGSMPQTLLASLHGGIQPIHEAAVRVPESVQAATPDSQRIQQGMPLTEINLSKHSEQYRSFGTPAFVCLLRRDQADRHGGRSRYGRV